VARKGAVNINNIPKMEEIVKEEVKERKRNKDLHYYLVQALVILAVVALGLLVVNQALEYRYKSVFLQQPCSVCKDLNPKVAHCLDNCFTNRIFTGDIIINFSTPSSP
jgi:predicted nucleic acid-binding Zn ribbon protein